MENKEIINNTEPLEWWQTFQGILDKMQEIKDENDFIKAENAKLMEDLVEKKSVRRSNGRSKKI